MSSVACGTCSRATAADATRARHLLRVEVINAVPPEQRICPLCGRTMTTVGHEVCEILEVEPARIYVLQRKDDMKTDGGGWTRFNWQRAPYVAGEDPLGQSLEQCQVDAKVCHGRIPLSASPTGLLVKDVTAAEHAAWKFDGTATSNAVLGAIRNKVEHCTAQQNAWMPYLNTSTESYCGLGAEGGCDSFYYTSGGCGGLTTWGLNLDGDNGYCASAFKLGATYPSGPGYCGDTADYGFLSGCLMPLDTPANCHDEFGELYYR